MLDIARDHRWGRVAESLGEDPFLAGELGAAMVRGFQKSDASAALQKHAAGGVAACLKHFAGYGAAEGGRDYNTTQISTEQLRNVYLPPFEKCVAAGAASVMVSFNEINGVPNSANAYLLRKVLRDDWKFNGLLVSDWGSVAELVPHGVAADKKDAAGKALTAGVDMDMEGGAFVPHLATLLKEGKISRTDLVAAVRRVLELKEKLGLFENPYIDIAKPLPFYTKEHLAAAKEAALQSIVLLQNKKVNGRELLPVAADAKIAIIGPLANAPFDQMGTWTVDGEKQRTRTPLTALRETAGDAINYAPGLQFSRDTSRKGFEAALTAARASDVVLFFAGEEASLSGEANCRADITLPGAQRELIAELAKVGKPLVLVIMSGRAIDIREELKLADAVLLALHPGTCGGDALAEIIFGKAVPTGKLPFSYPREVGQTPLYYNHKNTGRPAGNAKPNIADIPLEKAQGSLGYVSYYIDAGPKPLFPFGYGLSYTTYKYANLKIEPATNATGSGVNAWQISADITNTGTRAGVEIVQLYVRDRVGVVTRPVKELKGFRRVALAAGETKRITFTLTADALRYYDNTDTLRAPAGAFDVWVAGNSDCKTATATGSTGISTLHGEFTIAGENDKRTPVR